MPSSTSASNSAAVRYAKALLAICAILIAGLEVSANYLLRHNSATYTRISQQYKRALLIRSSEPGEPQSVLMVGNSLLLHGVQVDRLRSLTSSSMNLYPLFLEQTGYYDWYYALRKLFRQGARPDAVVVGVGVNYFLENGVRQDYAPMLFFDARDTLAVASDLQLDRTAASNLLLAHASTFWDTRSAVRTQMLNHSVPHLQELFSLISPKPSLPQGSEFAVIAVPRLQKLRDLCEEHGAKLILLVPPTLSSETAVGDMARAAQATGVDVSVPIDPEALSAKFYQPDGMHLNSDGAVLFTSALAKDLPERIIGHKTFSSRQQASTLNSFSKDSTRLQR